MKQLPIGIQTFKELITSGYVYVDKTALLYQMITTGKYYFLSRPRRFGKSMMRSTLKSIFSGEKELFQGTAIAGTDYDWVKYPVVVLDMSSFGHGTAEGFQKGLKEYLNELGAEFNIDLTDKEEPDGKLRFLVKTLAKEGQRVVLLIDEYDKPITDYLSTPSIANEVRALLARLYGVIKSLDEHLKFVFITGVSKFTKTSIFSTLNNLYDMSMQLDYATVVGYTEKELKAYFSDWIAKLAKALELSEEATVEKLRLWYNGYLFHPSAKEKVFSPQTVMTAFKSQELKDYWFRTGTPSFLMKIVNQFTFPLDEVDGSMVSERSLDPGDIERLTLPSILFQTGYLTIKSYDPESKMYTLTYPNFEVMEGLLQHMVAEISHKTADDYQNLTKHLNHALATGDTENFLTLLYNFIAGIPYFLGLEKNYQSVLYAILKLSGANVIAEDPTNKGRIDASIETSKYIYLIELKLTDAPDVAVEQILSREYFTKFLNSKKKIIAIGLTFDSPNRNLSRPWTIREIV